jgi:hypothetical protein
MQIALERFASFVALARERHARHLRFALVVGVLIAVLLWQTQWVTLRAALFLLLIGQIGTAVILLNRRRALSKLQGLDEAGMLAWFDSEEAFVKYAAAFENGVRTIGLMFLAYAFWVPTHNLRIALILGVAYPITVYFGMVRGNISRAVRRLKAQRSEIETLFSS